MRTPFATTSVLRSHESRPPDSWPLRDLFCQHGPIRDVRARGRHGVLLRHPSTDRLAVSLFELAGEVVDDILLVRGTDVAQSQWLADVGGPIRHGGSAGFD